MAKTAPALKRNLLVPDVQTGDTGLAISSADLRDQLKAHLNWCAYLGASVDGESLVDLAHLLRHTAKTMRKFAAQAEQCAGR
jgi:hypothetical protein